MSDVRGPGAVPPPPRPIELRDVDDRDWLLSVLSGVALVAIGIWLLTNLYDSVTILGLLVGASLLLGGVAEAVALGGAGRLGIVAWVAGGLLVAAGLVVLAWPDVTLWAIAVLAGLGLVGSGLLHVVRAVGPRDDPDRLVELGVGVLALAVGALVLAWPDATLVVLAVVLGLRAVMTGVVAIAAGWQLHRLA